MTSMLQKIKFLKELSEEEKKLINILLEQFINVDIEERPEYIAITETETQFLSRITKFIEKTSAIFILGFSDEEKLLAYTVVQEQIIYGFYKRAYIRHGPYSIEPEIRSDFINEIYNYYKKRKFSLLEIRPVESIGDDSQHCDVLINKKLKVKYKYGPFDNYSTLLIDIPGKTFPEIESKFSTYHKKSIKKAKKEGLHTVFAKTIEEIEAFADVFHLMNLKRGIGKDRRFYINQFSGFFHLLNNNKLGHFLLVKNELDEILGGIMIVNHGKGLKCKRGASHPSHRNKPILHLAIADSLNYAIESKALFLDFGGYNLIVNKEHQIYNINQFKKGFGGYNHFYAKTMFFNLAPIRIFFYELTFIIHQLLARKYKAFKRLLNQKLNKN